MDDDLSGTAGPAEKADGPAEKAKEMSVAPADKAKKMVEEAKLTEIES